MAAMLTTLDALKTELGITGTADDARLTKIIRRASATMERYCKRSFLRQEVTDIFRFDNWPWLGVSSVGGGYSSACFGGVQGLSARGYGLDYLLPTQPPVASITSITEQDVALTADDYEMDQLGRLWRLGETDYRRPWLPPRVVVVYQAGFLPPGTDGTDFPDDLERICLDLCVSSFHTSGRDPLLRSETIPGVLEQSWSVGTSVSTRGGLPLDIAQALDDGWALRL